MFILENALLVNECKYVFRKYSILFNIVINSVYMEQDDPCVLNIIRQKFLHPPSTLALQLEHPETENPSMGQAQSVMNILKNKVNIYTLKMDFKSISSVFVLARRVFH